MKKIAFFIFFTSFSSFANVEEDSLSNQLLSKTTSNSLKGFSSKKNVAYFQLLGDTPTIGIGYRRKVLETLNWKGELGLGLGFMPHLFSQRINPEPSKLQFSHSLVLVKMNEKLLKPFIGYSGIFYSGVFFENKLYNYIPSPNLGLRIGKSQDINFNIIWFGHLYKKDFQQIKSESQLETIRKTILLSVPAFNIQFSF